MKSLILSLVGIPLAVAQAGYFSNSSKSDKLSHVVKNIRVKWGDNNISSGTTRMDLYNVSSAGKKDLNGLGREAFATGFQNASSSGPAAVVKVLKTLAYKDKQSKMSASMVTRIAKIVAEGNAFDPKNAESLNELKKDVWAAVLSMGMDDMVVVETSATYTEEEDAHRVTSYVLTTPSESRALVIFVIEGNM